MAYNYIPPKKGNTPKPPECVVIPETIPCLFCGGSMERCGPTFLGSGVNSISYRCGRCNAVASHFCNHKRKIRSIDHHFHYEDEEDKPHG